MVRTRCGYPGRNAVSEMMQFDEMRQAQRLVKQGYL